MVMVGLGFLPGDRNSYAQGVNADGSVVVGQGVTQAFRWTATNGMVGLGFLPGGSISTALDVSADGKVVVGWGSDAVTGQVQAIRWTIKPTK
jgi:probable HAF family extracellular repeat protein